MLDVCLLGTSGMMPLPKRLLTAFMTRYNGSSILIDCGEGTQIAIKKKGWSFKPIDVICFTHFHADHISGLPGLLLTMGNAERTDDLTIIGPKGVENVVNSLRVIAPELPFKIRFIEMNQAIEEFRINGYKITAFKVNHNVTCYGYKIEIERNGKFMVDQAMKYQIPKQYWSRLQNGETICEDGKEYTPDMVLGEKRKGLKVVYCTDTRPLPIISEMALEADLFVCEGMYGEKGKEAKAKEYKHMTFYEAARLAKAAKPKQMWLTHFSPSLIKPEEFMNDVKKIYPNSYPGKDGKSLELLFEEEEK
ncbi:MAG: ribonuclease Z [Lachnospiraceae bacterium]|nr:ribonuclease Z [Lachnospiraceae bacterium]